MHVAKGRDNDVSIQEIVVVAVCWSVALLAILFTFYGWCAQKWSSSLVTKYETMCFCGRAAIVASFLLGVAVTIPITSRVLVPLLSVWVLAITSLFALLVGAGSILIGRQYYDKPPFWLYEACCHYLAPISACLLLDSLLINLIRALASLVG